MAREAKFNFEEERRLVDTSRVKRLMRHTATINGKHGYIRFSLDYIRDSSLNNTFIKFYADTGKKAIAWKILREKNLEDLNGYRHLVVRKQKIGKYETQTCQLGVGKLLETIGVKEQSYPHLTIKKYKPGFLDEELHYIELQ